MGGATRAPHQRQPQNHQQQNRRPEQGRGQQVQRKQQQQQSPQQQGGHAQHLGFQQSPEASPRLEQEQQEFQMQDTPQQSRHQHGGSNNQGYSSRRGGGGGGDMRSRNGPGSRYNANQPHFTQPSMPNAAETMVHFHKSFGVMQEIFEYRDFTTLRTDLQQCALAGAPPGQPAALRFLDLGCAPGGFSACLLQDEVLGSASMGFGVTLPPHMGGFSMGFASSRHFVQFEDIMVMEMDHLACADDSIHLCVADAQNLESFWKRASNPTTRYRGVRARSQSLGIWALTVKQCKLGFAKLKHQGTFIFRFGWRGIEQDVHPTGEQVSPELLAKYQQEEEWYKALTHWLFSVLKSLFASLKPFKSEYVHQADVSFYMVCHQFDRRKYEVHDWEAKLQRAFDELMDCSDEAELVAALANAISDNVKEEIDNLLSIVGRMRAIGINSRKITNPKSFTARWEEKRDDKEESGKSGKPLNSSKEGDEAEDGACPEVAVQSNDASVKAEGEGAPTPGNLSSQLNAMEQAPTASVSTTAPRQDDTAESADHSSEAAGATQETDIGALCGTSVAGGSCASSMGAAAAATSTARGTPEGTPNGGRQETNGRQFRGRQSEYARQRRCRRPPLVYTVINGHIVAVDASTVAALECESQYQQDIHIQGFQDQLKEHQHAMQAYQQPDHQVQFDQQQHPSSSSPMPGDLQQASLPLGALAGSSPMAAMSPEARLWMSSSGASPTDFYSQPSMATGGGCMEEYMVFNPEQAFLSDQNRFHIGDPYQANHHYMGEDAYHGCETYAADSWAGGAWAAPAGADAIQATSMQWHTPAVGSMEASIVPPPPSEPPRLPAEALSKAALLPPPPPSAPAKALTEMSKPGPLLERRHPAAIASSSSSCPTVPLLNGKIEAAPDPRRDNSAASIASTASAPAALAGRNKRGSRADLPRREVSEKVLEGDTFMSSDDDINDSSARGYRHKRRAGRLVRERRQGRKARNTALVSASTASETTLKDRFMEVCRELWQQLEGDVLEALRFGLVCAMAWMLLSIAISVLKLLRGEAR